MFLSQWREIFYPKSRIFKTLNIFLYNIHIFQYTVLSFFYLCSFWKFRWTSKSFKLVCKLQRCCTNWHTCAMITERKQDVITAKSFIPSIEITFCHWKCMTQMQKSIHICVRESFKKFGFFIGLNWKILISLPNVSCSLLKTDKLISSDCAFFLFH